MRFSHWKGRDIYARAQGRKCSIHAAPRPERNARAAKTPGDRKTGPDALKRDTPFVGAARLLDENGHSQHGVRPAGRGGRHAPAPAKPGGFRGGAADFLRRGRFRKIRGASHKPSDNRGRACQGSVGRRRRRRRRRRKALVRKRRRDRGVFGAHQSVLVGAGVEEALVRPSGDDESRGRGHSDRQSHRRHRRV
jgi:hypothetical protein